MLTSLLSVVVAVSPVVCTNCSDVGYVFVPCSLCKGAGRVPNPRHVCTKAGKLGSTDLYKPCPRCCPALSRRDMKGTGLVKLKCPDCKGRPKRK